MFTTVESSGSAAGKPPQNFNNSRGSASDVVVDPMLSALPYLRVRDKALFKPRDFILPWECVAGFSLASEEIQTTIDGAILKNAPEAPEKEAFSDSSVESSIRSYYRF